MKKYLLLATIMLPTLAFAQTPELTLKVTQPELDIISEGLQTQPFGKVVPLINKLRQQIIDQQPKPVVPEKPVEAPK